MRCIACGKRLYRKGKELLRQSTSVGYLCPTCACAYEIGVRDGMACSKAFSESSVGGYNRIEERLKNIERTVETLDANVRLIRMGRRL